MPVVDKISWSKLSLTAKALILLSIPLCLQLAFGIVLVQLQQEAEAEAQRANESRSIATEINSSLSDICRLCTFSITPKTKWLMEFQNYANFASPRYTELLHNVQKKYTILDKLTVKKPELNKSLRLAYKPFYEALQMIAEAKTGILAGREGSVVATSLAKSEHFELLGRNFITQELVILAKNEEDLANNSNKKQSEIRQTTVRCMFIVILANVVFSVLLARFLVQTIISRLAVIADNAVRVAAHKPLNPPLKGEDEIAKLDQAFHSMARTIDQSEQAKQDLYSMVTHDLRTPLAAIQGCLEMLALGQGEEFSPRSKKLIQVAVRNSTRTMGLVSDLLDSQKLEAGMLTLDATTVHLEDVFENVNLEIAGWVSELGIEIRWPATDLRVSANQDMLSRIIFNLISNDIKYSPRGSTISVGVTPTSNMAEITVIDQGPGIPKHMLKAAFERFRQASTTDPITPLSSGLGMSLCQDFVHLHQGKIWATSIPGHGSTFHFTVPLA